MHTRANKLTALIPAPRSPALLTPASPGRNPPSRQATELGRVFGGLGLGGGIVTTLWLLGLGATGSLKGWPWLIGVLLVAELVAVGVVRRPPPVRAYPWLVALVAVLISVGVYFTGEAASPMYLFYTWLIIFAAWYFPRRQVVLAVAWTIMLFAAACLVHIEGAERGAINFSSSDASSTLLLAATLIISAAVIRLFKARYVDSERRVGAAFDKSSTGMVLLEPSGRILEANPTFTRLTGMPHDLTGCGLAELLSPRDAPRVVALLEQVVTGGSSVRIEATIGCQPQDATVVELVASLISDERGRPLYMLAHVFDVTQRKAAEKLAAANAERSAQVARLSRAAVQGVGLDVLADDVTSTAATLLELDLVVLVLTQSEAAGFHLQAGNPPRVGVDLPASTHSWPAVERALADRELVVVTDWRDELRFEIGEVEHALGPRSTAVVPLPGDAGAAGALVAESGQDRRFGESDLDFLRTLANIYAEALAQRSAREDASRAALYDSLTGLPNRILLADLLRHSLERTGAATGSLAVLLFDLDHFKRVNDSFGHLASDQVLREMAARLASELRSADILARFGGDEFVVVAENPANERAVIRLAERLLAALGQPFSIGDEEVAIRATAGIAFADKNVGADALLRNAASATHRAKERSRGGYQLFDAAVLDRNVGRLRTENALRHAIERGELSLHYQPIVDAHTDQIHAVEALLRWHHPDWGPVSPSEFIPIAEESGMIIRIGRHVLSQSLDQLAAWRRGGRHVRLSVNLSPRQLLDDAIEALVATELRKRRLPFECLILELTESALVSDTGAARHTLAALRDRGVSIALDDYGTGYASLGYLSEFPVDLVKLDRTLIKPIGRSPKDTIIVASSLEMAHALGLRVVAEGIETVDQKTQLRELGCDLLQGYVFAAPMEPRRVEELDGWVSLAPTDPANSNGALIEAPAVGSARSG